MTKNANDNARDIGPVELAATTRKSAPRRAVLDLAPLELDCMNILWPAGEATVREIRDRLAERRPRAYTTIMTIMERLARKGIVERRKSGRSYTYRAHLSAAEARTQALAQVIDNFFAGSKEAMLGHLAGAPAEEPLHRSASEPQHSERPRAFAAAASASPQFSSAPTPPVSGATTTNPASAQNSKSDESDNAERIDDTLL